MKKRILQTSILAGCFLAFVIASSKIEYKDIVSVKCFEDIIEPIPSHIIEIGEVSNIIDTPVQIKEEIWTDSLEYVAMCVEAEAGNQGYLGKLFVADCILNRYDKGDYANYYEVINEDGQFSCVTDGHIYCVPTEETYRAVKHELADRTNGDIIYFRTGRYSDYGTPAFQWLDHYFSEG